MNPMISYLYWWALGVNSVESLGWILNGTTSIKHLADLKKHVAFKDFPKWYQNVIVFCCDRRIK